MYSHSTYNISLICVYCTCGSLVVVLTLSIREVVSSSPARAGRVKPYTFKMGSDCYFAKSTAFRCENHGSFR
jgi:hypothetical protein